MACEMCGTKEIRHLARVEGVVMKVCNECARFGEIIKTLQEKKESRPREEMRENRTAPPAGPQKIQVITPNFAERIRRCREGQGMKQKDFARMLSEKESLIHNLEAGKIRPSIELARKLEKTLRIRLVEQVEDNGEVKTRHASDDQLTIGDLLS